MTHVANMQSWVVRMVIASLVLSSVIATVRPVHAAALTSMSDTMTRQKTTTLSDHGIVFTATSGVGAGGTIVVTFPSGFDGTTAGDPSGPLDDTDVDVIVDSSADGICDDAGTELTIGSAPSLGTWGAVFSGTNLVTLTITSGTGTIASSSEVCVLIGDHADGSVGGTSYPDGSVVLGHSQYQNPGSAGSKTITIAAGADTGTIAVPIDDNDRVQLSATVNASITFDLDTATSDTNSGQPYSVDLGTLSSGTLTTSDQSTINSIFMDIDTNAAGGAVVTVEGANTGLASTSASHTITLGSTETTIAAGEEKIGLCVESVSAGLTKGTQYDSTGGACSLTNTGTQAVGEIETTATQIINTTSAPVASGRAEVLVKASVSGTTPAATDYSNVLTFIATATF